MKSFKKLLLLSVLGLGVCVEKSFADPVRDEKIHIAVVKAFDDKKTLNRTTLPEILKNLKEHVITIITYAAGEERKAYSEYENLYEALKNLNPDNLLMAYGQIKTVLIYLPVKTAHYVRKILAEYGL
jgi:hypothetical protein